GELGIAHAAVVGDSPGRSFQHAHWTCRTPRIPGWKRQVNAIEPLFLRTVVALVPGFRSASKLWSAAVTVWRRKSRFTQTIESPLCSPAGSEPYFILSITTVKVRAAAGAGKAASSNAPTTTTEVADHRRRIAISASRQPLPHASDARGTG